MTRAAAHPAKWSEAVLVAIHDAAEAEAERLGRKLANALDPFAGVGRARLAEALKPYVRHVDGIELQPEWCGDDPFTVQGSAIALPPDFAGSYEAVFTSPAFANRMADKHQAKDPCGTCHGKGAQEAVAGHCFDIDGGLWHEPGGCRAPECGYPERPARCCPVCPTCNGTGLSKRYTYAHYLRAAGGDLVPGSAAGMPWDREYRMFHRDALREMIRVLVPGGLLAINMSNHFRTLVKGGPQVEQDVVGWWVNQIIVAGCMLRGVVPVDTPRNKVGANADVRAECEYLITAHTPDPRRTP